MREIKREIVGAVIMTQDNKILLGKQDKGGVWDECWHIPGGGIEEGENLNQALIREIKEETLLDISDWTISLVSDKNFAKAEKILKETGEKVIVNMQFFDFIVKSQKLSTEIKLANSGDGFSEMKWFGFDELKNLELTNSEEKLFKMIGILE